MKLTYNEFLELGFGEIGEEVFNQYLPKATDVIDDITGHFVYFDSNDVAPFVIRQYKKAICAQIEHFNEHQTTTTSGLNQYTNVSIGRTSITNGVRNSSNEKSHIYSDDALMYLRHTGLLYRGVDNVST